MVYRKRQDVPVFAQMHLAVLCTVFAQCFYGSLHRYQATVSILVRVNRRCSWMVITKHPGSSPGFDAIATYHGIGLRDSTVVELHCHLAVRRGLLDSIKMLLELRDALWNQLHQLV